MWTDFHNVFTVKSRKYLWMKLELKLSPLLKAVTLRNFSGQLYSFTAQSIQSDAKTYIYSKCTEGC